MIKNIIKKTLEYFFEFIKTFENKHHFEETQIKKVLIIHIKPLGIGDAIMSDPGFSLISKKYKTSILTNYSEIYYNDTRFEKIIKWPDTLIEKLKLIKQLKQKYGLIISNSKAINQLFLSKYLTQKYYIGYGGKWNIYSNFILNKKYQYTVDSHYLNLIQNICSNLNVNEKNIQKIQLKEISSSKKDKLYVDKLIKEKKYVVITPNVAWKSRTYSPKKMIEVIEKLKIKKIILIGHGDKDLEVSNQIVKSSKKHILNLVNKLSLNQLSYLLKKANLHICGDCGPMHIGFAQKTPTIALFGPINPKTRLPLINNSKYYSLWKGNLIKHKSNYNLERETTYKECPIINKIKKKEIINLANKIIK